jgi:hypothetical protein
MAGSCLHVLDRDRSGSAFGGQRCDAEEARRQTRRAGRAGLVPREIDHDRAEIAARSVQSVAAIGARALLRAGAQWWVCRSAHAAMWALARSGVCFRTLTNGDGTLECWQQPELAVWEVPKRNPHERRPRAPDWELNKVGAEIAELAAASDDAARAVTSPHREPCIGILVGVAIGIGVMIAPAII